MLKRLAAVAALLVVPFTLASPTFAAPPSGTPTPAASADPAESEDEDAEEEEDAGGDTGTFGYSAGVDPRTWQWNNSLMIRHSPWGSWSEAILGLNTRSQIIEPNRLYALESVGLAAHLGAKAWFLRLGVAAELAWVKRIRQTGGLLNFENSPGFLVEPYIGTTLPFLQTPFTTLDARVYVPISSFMAVPGWLNADPAYGPRVMVNLWVGVPPMGQDEEDEEEDEDVEEGPTDPEEDEEESEEEAVPAPAPRKVAPTPTPKPTPKPTAKPTPKK